MSPVTMAALGVLATCVAHAGAAGQPVAGELNVELTITEPAGLARAGEPVTVGVPLPLAASITDVDGLGVFDGGTEMDAQFRVLSRWDGPPEDETRPIRWVLIDFQVDLGADQTKTVLLTDTGSGGAASSPLFIDWSDPAVAVIQTGSMEAVLSRSRGNVFERVSVGGQVVVQDTTTTRERSGVTLVNGDGTVYRAASAPDPEFAVEEQGPLRLTVRIATELAHPVAGVLRPGEVRVIHRLHFYANRSFVRMHVQLENNALYGEFAGFEDATYLQNLLDIDSLRLDIPLQLSGDWTFRTSGFQDTGNPTDAWRVLQGHVLNNPNDESQNFFYQVTRNGAAIGSGDRHDGWIDIAAANGSVTAGVRWFWQNYEKALSVTAERLAIELWPQEGFYPPDRTPANLYRFEGARHKSHEVFLLFGDSPGADPASAISRLAEPLVARAPARWYYETGALGMTDPGDLIFSQTDDDDRMNTAYLRYNTLMRLRADGIPPDPDRPGPVRNLVEAKEHRFMVGDWDTADWYGWAHFGDNAWGDGYSSNHYDMCGFLMIHYLRLGDRALWDLAEPHIRQASEMGQVWSTDPNPHIAPVSFYEKTNHGLAVEWARPLASHNWVRRLVLYYWLTGNRTAYEAAMLNAEGLRRYFYEAWDITDPASIAFEPDDWSILTENRFITWSLDNVLEIYAMTGEQKWIALAEDLVRALLYAFGRVGHLNGPRPHEIGASLMSHYGGEPIIRFHQASNNVELRDQVLEMLRGMITSTYQVDRMAPQGSGTNYRPAVLANDWDDFAAGPESHDTLYNGFAASLYAYVGWLDRNDAYIQIANRLWADGTFYPEYYAEYPNRFPVDYDNYWNWGWSSSTYPGSDEKVWSRQTRSGIPYLWVLNQIRDRHTSCVSGDLDGDGDVDLSDFVTFVRCFGLTAPTGECDAEELSCSDLTGDGEVNLNDFATFARNFTG